jgi:peptidoglycan/xylan/chitin deacetylase (PgdA/CDA1 family)
MKLSVIVPTSNRQGALTSVRLPVLLYHRVGPPQPGTPPGLTVSPARFERHVRWLARKGFHGILPADWLRWLKEGTPLPNKPVLLTFDDAYEDLAEFAFPILRRYGFGGAVYVVTKRVGETNLWDQAQSSGALRLMNEEQIRFWAAQGIEFGAHSRTHPDLTKLPAAELEAEVVGSKRDLSRLLGYPIVSFAYPYGYYNDAVLNLVRAEFELAFSVEEGLNYLTGDPHLIRRAYVAPSDPTLAIAWIVRRGTARNFHEWRIRIGLRSRIRKVLGLSAS